MSNEPMEVWCVKYALTQGIFKVGGVSNPDGKRFSCGADRYHQQLGPYEWASNLETAKIMAEEMRKKKVASLEKQIEKARSQDIKVLRF